MSCWAPTESLPRRWRALLCAAALLLIGACSNAADQRQAPRAKPLPKVKIAQVEVKSLTEVLELTGAIEPSRLARMASPVEGPVIACLVREGDLVRARQLLARLGRTKGDDAVAASAKAELNREELELGRIEKLVKSGALPSQDLDTVRVKVSDAQAKLARARERLGDYRVSAPWPGVVSKVNVAVGDFVSARATLIELFDPKSLVLRFAVPEQSAARVRDGAPITVTLDAHPGQTFAAKVIRRFPVIDRRTHTRTVEGAIKGAVALAPGMFARLQLALATAPEALTVPVEAVVRRRGKTTVFVISSDGAAAQRAVKLGMEVAGRVQILTGVHKGERVAVAGHKRLRHGKKVRVTKGRKAREGRGGAGAARAGGKAR